MVNMLLKMDFLIVKCEIQNGLLVLGPGQAFEINSNQMIHDRVAPLKGHGQK